MAVSLSEVGHSMTIIDWAIVIATVAGPIFAIQVQKAIERLQEKRNAKLWVFRQLMATLTGARTGPQYD